MSDEDEARFNIEYYDDDYEKKVEEVFSKMLDIQFRRSRSKQSKRIHIVEDFIEDRSLNVVYGSRGSGKSLLLVDLITHVNNGAHWANKATTYCDSWYIIYEDPEHIDLRDEITRQVKFPNPKEGVYSAISETEQDIFSPYFETALERQRAANHCGDEKHLSNKPQVLVIDTLSYVAAEIGDENNHSTMAPIIKKLRKFISIGWTVFLVTHSGKNSSKGVRGHSSIEGAADNIFHVTSQISKKGSSEIITLRQTKARNRSISKVPILRFQIKFGVIKGTGENVPYIEFLDKGETQVASAKPSQREVAVLNILDGLIKTEPTNVKIIFGLDMDFFAIQLAQLEASFIAKNIAPQAKSKASQAKALKRTLESLAEKGLINERNGFYWLPENEQTNDDKQT